jgi:heat shock protein HslJ
MRSETLLPALALLVFFVSTANTQTTTPQLAGTSWQLVRFQSGDGTTLSPEDKNKYTLAFANDGGVSVRIDCNRGHGTWKSSAPSQLELGPLALTRAMCPAAPLTDRIPKDWPHVRSYLLKDGHLFLSLMADAGVYEFEPNPSQESVLSGLPTTFVGTLPCADCPGIHYQVNLLADHTFVSRMTYEDRNTSLSEAGIWQVANGKTLLLQTKNHTREQFAMLDEQTLRKLDINGNEIESKLNYDLKRAPHFLPIEQPGHSGGQASLENTHWKLTRLGRTQVNDSTQQEAYLVLNPQNLQVSGSGGCNRITGSYKLKGQELTFSRMVATMMACMQGMDTEKRFLKALGDVTSWKIIRQTLEVFDDNKTPLAEFEAVH